MSNPNMMCQNPVWSVKSGECIQEVRGRAAWSARQHFCVSGLALSFVFCIPMHTKAGEVRGRTTWSVRQYFCVSGLALL